jgi:glutamate dehydrogenase (NADP+)
MTYSQQIIENTIKKTPGESEFHQTVTEVLTSLAAVVDNEPRYQAAGLLERLVAPERVIQYRVPWQDDAGKVHVNTGYRVQFNSAIGPYKGGMRFHPSVTLSVQKFLALSRLLKIR